MFPRDLLWRPPRSINETEIELLYKRNSKENKSFAKNGSRVRIHYTGRLVHSGCVFDGSRSKNGGVPFEFTVGDGSVVPGMDDAVRAISLGEACRARVPPSRGYGQNGVHRLIPCNTAIIFDVILLGIDNQEVSAEEAQLATVNFLQDDGFSIEVIQRFKAPPELQAFVQLYKKLKDQKTAWLSALKGSREVPNYQGKRWVGLSNVGSEGLCVLDSTFLDCSWSRLRETWTWDFLQAPGWPKENLVLAKLKAPIRPDENLNDIAIVETTISSFVKYMLKIDPFDEEVPRFYVNGWQPSEFKVFGNDQSLKIPIVEDLTLSHMTDFEIEVNALLFGRDDKKAVSRACANAQANSDKLNKVFIGPAGATTRLHQDNHGAHARLTMLKGSKLYIAFHPQDAPNLYPPSASYIAENQTPRTASSTSHYSPIDPLNPNLDKYPNYKHATPYLALLTEGESLLLPKNWWHCAYSLSPSITVMRNFWSSSNIDDLIQLQKRELEMKLRALKAAGLLRTS